MPAADLSEQISTAGMEASGTGNMKFALNGALTIGTLDGANVEIQERVGDDNIVIFGLTAEEVAEARAATATARAPSSKRSPELSQALAAIASGVFSPDDPRPLPRPGRRPLRPRLVHGRRRFRRLRRRPARGRRHLARTSRDWYAKAIRNTARMGWFSSDRTIRQYAERHLERAVIDPDEAC